MSRTSIKQDRHFSNSFRWTVPGMSNDESPAFERDEATEMREDYWHLTEDLKEGTKAMRAAGQVWLPKEPREKHTTYTNRIKRSVLKNAYRSAIDKTVARPFSQPVTVDNEDKLPELLQDMSENFDRRGTSITVHASRLFWIGLHRGFVHQVVSFPEMPEDATKRDDEEMDARPFATILDPVNVLGWNSEINAQGKEILTELRYLEKGSERSGKYGTKNVWYIKVLTPDEYEVFKLSDDLQTWNSVNSGSHTYGKVPLQTLSLDGDVDELGDSLRMTGRPVFLDLAWLNLTHWQSNSDQRNILRFARTGMYFAKGFSKKQVQAITIGPDQIVSTEDENGDFKVVEYQGSSIELGYKDLKEIELQMEAISASPLLEKPGDITATETSVNEAKSNTQIQAWVRLLESFLKETYLMAARWTEPKYELPEDFQVSVFNDFSSKMGADGELLIKSRAAREIDQETFLREMRRRGVLGEDADIDEIIAALENEGPSLDMMNQGLAQEEEDDSAQLDDDDDELDDEE